MVYKTALAASSAAIALMSGGQASAQQNGPTATQQVTNASGSAGPTKLASSGIPAASVSEVIVTAQRRAENIEKVPVAISAYTSKQRDLIGIDTVQDIANFTPGLEYSTTLDRAYIRGVGRQTNNLAEDPGVATYFDGVYNSSVVAASGDSLFVDRVEVLRGPQGTLYGRNSIAGAINSVSRRPTDDFYAEARTTIGNYGTYNGEAAVSGPLTNNIQGRLAILTDNQDKGYFSDQSGLKSEGGKGNTEYLEAQLQGNFGHIDVWGKFGVFYYDNTYRSANLIGSYEYNPFPPGVLTPTAAYGLSLPGVSTLGPNMPLNPANGNVRDIDTNTPSRAKLDNDYNATIQAAYHFPGVDVKYIGAYTIYRYKLSLDADGTAVNHYQIPSSLGYPPLDVYPTEIESYQESKEYNSNEIDISSTSKSRFQWIAGVYQYHESFDQPIQFSEPSQPQIYAPDNITGTGPAPASPGGVYYRQDEDLRSESYAVFGQADYQITDQLRLTGGVRYTKDKKYGNEDNRAICLGLPTCAPATTYGTYTPALDVTSALISFAPAPGVDGPAVAQANGSYDRRLDGQWGAVTGTAGLEYSPNATTLTYAKYSRGYKSGGFNGGPIVADPETLPETINAYEAGAKEVFNRKLQANLALFYYDYTDLQIPLQVLPAAGPEQTLIFNIDHSRSYGAELETIWQATDALRFLLSYSYLNAKVTSNAPLEDAVQPALGAQNIDGQRLPQSPTNKFALNGNYTWRFAPGDLTYSLDYIFKGSSYDSVFDRPYYEAPSYSQVDMRALFNDRNNRFTVIAFVKNLTNVTAYDNVTGNLVVSPAPGYPNYNSVANLIPPRTYGVQLQVRFR